MGLKTVTSTSTKYKNKWVHIAKERIAIKDKNLLFSKQSFEDLEFPPRCSSFYKQVLEYWFNFFSKEPDSYLEILQEIIIYNRFIKIGNGQLDKNFDFLKCHNIIKIADIIEGSDFLPKYHLEKKMHHHIPTLLYNYLISTIPQKWKLLIKSNTMPDCYSKYNLPHLKNIPQLKTRDICGHFTFVKTLPTGVDKWIEH